LFADDKTDEGVTKAYETVLILTLKKLDNPEYLAFATKVKEAAKLPPYNFDFDKNNEEVNILKHTMYLLQTMY
jgi:hypothetical protein